MLCHVFLSQVEYKIVCFILGTQHVYLYTQQYQHVFVCTLDVAVDTQHEHLCSWIYSSCVCINNFNLIGWTKLVVYTILFLCKQHQMLCKLRLQLPMILESFLF